MFRGSVWRRWDQKTKKSEIPPSRLDSESPQLGHRRQLLSTKSRFPLRAAVRSVQTSQKHSSSLVRSGGVWCGGGRQDAVNGGLLAPSPARMPVGVCFVSSDQPTRTGGSPPLAACEVGAARCCSQVSPDQRGGGVPAGTFKTKKSLID